MSSEGVLTLPDGRALMWAEQGAADGVPVLCLHGSPGSRFARHVYESDLVESGIRQITYDRPGFGGSDPHPGRTVADCVGDIFALLDHFGIDKVPVIGGSGGGPHSLAMATVGAQRCTVAYCFVGVAPWDAEGLDFFDGMDDKNVARFTAIDPDDRQGTWERVSPEFFAAREDDPLAIISAMDLPEADRKVLEETGPMFRASFAEAFRPGTWGFVDDWIAYRKPWGFDVRDAAAPVVIEYGIHDVNVPAAHGRWLGEHVKGARVVVSEAEGHLSPPGLNLQRLKDAAEGKV